MIRRRANMDSNFERTDGRSLQDLRKAAADRFYAIGMAHLPEGWTYKFRKTLSGRAFISEKRIEAPKPITRKALYIWLHECAHANGISRTTMRKPVHVIEMLAEQWAHQKMRENGVPVPKEMTARAKRYVTRKIHRAMASGAKTIDPRALAYTKRKS